MSRIWMMLSGNVSTVNIKLGSNSLNLNKTFGISEGLNMTGQPLSPEQIDVLKLGL